MLLLAFHPHCNKKIKRVAETFPSYYTVACAANLNELLAKDNELKLHPMLWERLFYSAGWTMHTAKQSLDLKDKKRWRWGIGQKFFLRFSQRSKLLLGIREAANDINPTHTEKAIIIGAFDCIPAWIYALVSYRVPEGFVTDEWSTLDTTEVGNTPKVRHQELMAISAL
jgi:hypothetical protein